MENPRLFVACLRPREIDVVRVHHDSLYEHYLERKIRIPLNVHTKDYKPPDPEVFIQNTLGPDGFKPWEKIVADGQLLMDESDTSKIKDELEHLSCQLKISAENDDDFVSSVEIADLISADIQAEKDFLLRGYNPFPLFVKFNLYDQAKETDEPNERLTLPPNFEETYRLSYKKSMNAAIELHSDPNKKISSLKPKPEEDIFADYIPLPENWKLPLKPFARDRNVNVDPFASCLKKISLNESEYCFEDKSMITFLWNLVTQLGGLAVELSESKLLEMPQLLELLDQLAAEESELSSSPGFDSPKKWGETDLSNRESEGDSSSLDENLSKDSNQKDGKQENKWKKRFLKKISSSNRERKRKKLFQHRKDAKKFKTPSGDGDGKDMEMNSVPQLTGCKLQISVIPFSLEEESEMTDFQDGPAKHLEPISCDQNKFDPRSCKLPAQKPTFPYKSKLGDSRIKKLTNWSSSCDSTPTKFKFSTNKKPSDLPNKKLASSKAYHSRFKKLTLSPDEKLDNSPQKTLTLASMAKSGNPPSKKLTLSPVAKSCESPPKKLMLAAKTRYNSPTKELMMTSNAKFYDSPTKQLTITSTARNCHSPTKELRMTSKGRNCNSPTKELRMSSKGRNYDSPNKHLTIASKTRNYHSPTKEPMMASRARHCNSPTKKLMMASNARNCDSPTKELMMTSKARHCDSPTKVLMMASRARHFDSPTKELMMASKARNCNSPTKELMMASKARNCDSPTKELMMASKARNCDSPSKQLTVPSTARNCHSPTKELVMASKARNCDSPSKQLTVPSTARNCHSPTKELVMASKARNYDSPTKELVMASKARNCDSPSKQLTVASTARNCHSPTKELVMASKARNCDSPTKQLTIASKTRNSNSPTKELMVSSKARYCDSPNQQLTIASTARNSHSPTKELIMSSKTRYCDSPTEQLSLGSSDYDSQTEQLADIYQMPVQENTEDFYGTETPLKSILKKPKRLPVEAADDIPVISKLSKKKINLE